MVANNGRETLAALDKERFDAVLMDVEMPEMDGYEATAAIRANERGTGQHIPILAMTAHAMKGAREQCLEAGMDSYVSKPLYPRTIIDAIETLVPVDGASPHEQPTTKQAAAVLDRTLLLDRVGGDEELLRELVTVFLGDCPTLVEKIRAAIDHADAPRLRSTAHTLKGVVATFGACAPYEAAGDLENLGRAGDLTQAPAIFVTLESELHWLQSALAALLSCGLQCQHGSLQRD